MGGKLLPAAPLQPCAEASLGRGNIVSSLDWVNLAAPGNYASNYTPLALKARGTPSARRRVPSPGGQYGSWVSFAPCQYIPCLSFTPKLCLFSFTVQKNINYHISNSPKHDLSPRSADRSQNGRLRAGCKHCHPMGP